MKVLRIALLLILAGGNNQTSIAPSDESTATDKNSANVFEENSIKSVGTATFNNSEKVVIKGDFKVGDGVLINPDTSRSRSTDSGKYYLTDNGYYLVMATEDGKLEFDAATIDSQKGRVSA